MQNPTRQQTIAFLAITTGIILGIFFIAKLTGILQWYHIPTPSNEPAIKKNSYIWSSNLKKPARYSFILYHTYDSTFNRPAIFVFRCVGIPGDVIEMRKGVMYVNGKNTDAGYEFMKPYHVYSSNPSQLFKNAGYEDDRDEEEKFDNTDMANVNLTNIDFKKISAACVPGKDSIILTIYNLPPEMTGFLNRQGNGKWSLDNFGPLRVPMNSYFVLGDNRYNAMDSRFTGFVAEADIVGVVIGK